MLWNLKIEGKAIIVLCLSFNCISDRPKDIVAATPDSSTLSQFIDLWRSPLFLRLTINCFYQGQEIKNINGTEANLDRLQYLFVYMVY